MEIIGTGLSGREADPGVSELIRGRWSPRAMSGEVVTLQELNILFSAARWAPSAYNEQPWRMLYALRSSPEWQLFFNLMVEFNQGWTQTAGALVVFMSRKVSSHNAAPLATHSFDAGAAWQNFCLQGVSMNLVVHGMSGFDYDRARKDLQIPDYMQIEAMAAVGRPAPATTLPPPLRERESPSGRRPITQLVAAGKWSASLG